MTVKTRKPTGKPNWPLVLLAGGEGSGKSFLSAQASASDLIGQTYWIGHGEQDPDEYALIPGADFDIVEYDGTVSALKANIREIAAKPKRADGKAVLLVVDSGSKLWDTVSENAQQDANRRANKPDATITVDTWNRHKEHWRDIVDALRAHHGPAIITARYEEVAVIVKGVPTGERVWKVKAEKGLPYDVDAVVHMPERGTVTLSKVRSVRIQLDKPRDWPNFTLDALWRAMGLDEVEAGQSSYATPVVEVDGSIQPHPDADRDWMRELSEADTAEDVAALGNAALAAGAPRETVSAIRRKHTELTKPARGADEKEGQHGTRK